MSRSSQRFACLVKICDPVALISRARAAYSLVPPATETCAPRGARSLVQSPASTTMGAAIDGAGGEGAFRAETFFAGAAVADFLAGMTNNISVYRCPRSHSSGSTERPFGRISKCRCGGRSGSVAPTVPIICPFGICCPLRTSMRDNDPYTE